MTNIKKWIDERGFHEGDYLGDLCRNNHEYLDTGKSIRCKRIVRKGSKSGKEQKNGKCICCMKVEKDKHYATHKEDKKNYYEKNIEHIKKRTKEKYCLNMLDSVFRANRIEYKRIKRREKGVKSREEIGLETALKKAGAPTVIELVNKQIKKAQVEARLEYLKTPKGRAAYQRNLYKTSWRQNLMQKEKNQRRKSRDKGNYNEKKSPTQLKARLLAFNNCCAYCNIQLTTFSVQFDHVIPSSKGGPDILANLVPSCHSCNHNKFDHEMKKWFLSKPFYSKERLDKIKKVLALTPYPTKQTEMFHDWQIS